MQVLCVLAGLVAALWLHPWFDSHRYRRLAAAATAEFYVTSSANNGPGSLREALFNALRADEPATVVLQVREAFVNTPLPPLATRTAIQVRSDGEPRTIVAAASLTRPVFDVRAGRFELDGVAIRGASSAYAVHTTSPERATLRQFDTISFPPGVCRAFRNVGTDEGILQVLITGGVHDMTDIAFSPKAREEIESVGRGLAARFEQVGFTFDAGA